MLLSLLGNADNGDIGRRGREAESGLARYLETHLASRVKIIKHNKDHKIKFALPIDANINDYGGDNKENSTSVSRFVPAFWTAFRKSLDSSKNRYIHVEMPIWFIDCMPDEADTSLVEIDREYIASNDTADSEVLQKIKEWLGNNNYSKDRFLGKQIKEKEKYMNLLDKIIASLTENDLSRISIPMDVVKKLRDVRL